MRTLANNLGFSDEEMAAALTVLQDSSAAVREEVTQEATFNTEEVQDSARLHLDFFAGLAMPDTYSYAFPPVYLSVWDWLLSYAYKTRDFSQLALGLPRGFAKTTIIKLFILYCITYTNRKFILVMSENQEKANNIISDVMDMLSHPNIKAVFGDWRNAVEKDTQTVKKFGFRGRNIVVMAGVVETVRGINLKNERPDVMIFDDIQSRECAESQIQSTNLEREMIGTAMKAKSPHGCLFVFVANMYATRWSILRKLKTNPNWVKFIAGGILANGTSLWEELQPIEQLKREYQNDLSMGKPEIFHAEVLNDENASSNNLLDLTMLPPYPYQDDDISSGNFIIIDPAGDKETSDAVSIGYCEIHDGHQCLIDIVEDRLSPGETIEKALKLAIKYGCRLVAIESTAYQASLGYWFRYICYQRGIIGIEAVEVYPGSLSKSTRIISMIRAYMKGELFVHPRCQAAVHLQMTQYNAMKRDNTDGLLDLLVYMPKVVEIYGNFVSSNAIISSQEFNSVSVPLNNSPF